jgi:hypothetical protein
VTTQLLYLSFCSSRALCFFCLLASKIDELFYTPSYYKGGVSKKHIMLIKTFKTVFILFRVSSPFFLNSGCEPGGREERWKVCVAGGVSVVRTRQYLCGSRPPARTIIN